MKIQIAVHTYFPNRDGVQAVTQYISEGLVQKGHEVLVVTNSVNGCSEKEFYNGVAIERISVHRNFFHKFVGEKKKYLSRITAYQPDVLIAVCTQSWPFDWVMKGLDKLSCKKVLYTHGYSEYETDYQFWKKMRNGQFGKAFNVILNKKYYTNAHKYIAKYDLVTYLHSKDKAVQYAQKYGLKNGKILGNAVEDRFLEPLPIKDKVWNEIIFLYVAAYSDKKGQELVLRSFLMANMKNARLVFCGQTRNEYYDYLLEINEKLNVGCDRQKVEFYYEKSREEIYNLYRSSDVFVCGSKIEAFSISLCEAAASGLACISTDVGNASSIPELIIANSEEEMSSAMTYLYSNCDERERRAKCLRCYAENNCRIQDKVDWFEEELLKLLKG